MHVVLQNPAHDINLIPLIAESFCLWQGTLAVSVQKVQIDLLNRSH